MSDGQIWKPTIHARPGAWSLTLERLDLCVSIRGRGEVSAEYKTGGRHRSITCGREVKFRRIGVSSDTDSGAVRVKAATRGRTWEHEVELFHHFNAVQPHVGDGYEHGVFILLLQLLELGWGFHGRGGGTAKKVDVAVVGPSNKGSKGEGLSASFSCHSWKTQRMMASDQLEIHAHLRPSSTDLLSPPTGSWGVKAFSITCKSFPGECFIMFWDFP